MAIVDIIVPTYKGIAAEAYSSLTVMLQQTNCACRNAQGAPKHMPWKCDAGKHSVRMMPPIMGGSVVHWTRNQSVAQALFGQPEDGRPPADYFLLMDDDMTSEPHFLKQLLSYKKDIVCGICTIRRDPPRPNIRYWNEEKAVFYDPVEWDWDSQKLMQIDAAGAAYMLVKRGVFERMGDAYLNCEFELAEDMRKLTSEDGKGELISYWEKKAERRRLRFQTALEQKNWQMADLWWFTFEKNVVNHQMGELGEDLSFCWKAKKLGYQIWADPQVLPGHLGNYSYSIKDHREFVEAAKANGSYKAPKEQNQVALVGA